MADKVVLVEVEGYEGLAGSIIVTDETGASTDEDFGINPKLYCVGILDADNKVTLVDWGYASPEEAKAAWKELQ